MRTGAVSCTAGVHLGARMCAAGAMRRARLKVREFWAYFAPLAPAHRLPLESGTRRSQEERR